MRSSSASMTIAAGGSTVLRMPKRRTRTANSPVSKPSMTTTGAPARNAKSTW